MKSSRIRNIEAIQRVFLTIFGELSAIALVTLTTFKTNQELIG